MRGQRDGGVVEGHLVVRDSVRSVGGLRDVQAIVLLQAQTNRGSINRWGISGLLGAGDFARLEQIL